MFDNIYSTLVKKVPYKPLILVPILASVLMLFVLYFNGLPLGIDFRGGTLIELTSEKDIDQASLASLRAGLADAGLEDLKVLPGKDLETGQVKVSISTTSVGPEELDEAKSVLSGFFGELRESDTAWADIEGELPEDLEERLSSRLRQSIDVKYDEKTGILEVMALSLDESELESALSFYLGDEVKVELEEKNLNIDQVQPSLGEKLRTDGIKAGVVGYILMAFVIFIAFRDFIPSLAVLLSATCDGIITLGLMSIFGLQLDPASLVALLMLIGYSVDTDVLLTTRALKKRKGDVNENIDGAIKTGLTMTGTTFTVMLVVMVVSTYFTHVSTLTSIASVLLLGLFADVSSTWFMNAGILKWYLEEKGGRFSIIGKVKKKAAGK